MRNLGVTLTEIAGLEKLAADCAADGHYDVPLRRGAAEGRTRRTGSPVNPVVIK